MRGLQVLDRRPLTPLRDRLGVIPNSRLSVTSEAWRAVLLLGRRAWSWRTHDVPDPYGILPFQRRDRTIKPWDQTLHVVAFACIMMKQATALAVSS